jgi:hypothetical protein
MAGYATFSVLGADVAPSDPFAPAFGRTCFALRHTARSSGSFASRG